MSSPPYALMSMIVGVFSLLVFGTLIVFAFIHGRRSGGYLAATGLIVMLVGSVANTWMVPAVGHFVPIAVTFVGLVLIVAGIGINVSKHRLAG